jgi:hypothetical protein
MQKARIEHVAFEVDNLEEMAEKLRYRGVETTTDTPGIVGPTRSLVTRSETTYGVAYRIFDRRTDQK